MAYVTHDAHYVRTVSSWESKVSSAKKEFRMLYQSGGKTVLADVILLDDKGAFTT